MASLDNREGYPQSCQAIPASSRSFMMLASFMMALGSLQIDLILVEDSRSHEIPYNCKEINWNHKVSSCATLCKIGEPRHVDLMFLKGSMFLIYKSSAKEQNLIKNG